MGLIILIVIHAVVLLVGVAAALLIPPVITAKLVVSVIFCAIAYLAFAGATVFAAFQSKESSTQNIGLITTTLLYLIAALVGSVILTLLPLSIKIHILLEIVIMAAGIVLALLMLLAKLHIEKQD